MIDSRYSVAIIGAGPTGLVLANLLGKAGVRTLLIEANAATVGEPRAVSIDDESLRVVQRMGLEDVVKTEIVSGYGSEYLGPDGRMFLKVKPLAEPYGHPRRNAFRQPVFEAQLREGLKRYPVVTTKFQCRAKRFEDDGKEVTLDLTLADGETERVTADYLIGCDGSWSSVREALGYSLSGSSLDERWLIIDLVNSPSTSPETLVYCDPKRSGIMLPGPRNTRRYEFKLLPNESDEHVLDEARIAELLHAYNAVPGSRIVRKTVYHFHARISDHWGRGRVWLAGDAAHLMPPFAGQGMNSGVRDAANIAWKLAAVLGQRIGPKLLETYEPERRGHVADMIKLALRMGQVFGPRTRRRGWLIRTAFRCLGIWPAAKSFFAEMKYKPTPRFEDGFILSSHTSRRGIVGRLLPQPVLRSANGDIKLDELLGEGFALIGIDLDLEQVKTVSLGSRWNDLVSHRLTITLHDAPQFAEHAGKLLLVRPDRYVMARIDPAGLRQAVDELDALLLATWPAGSNEAAVSTTPRKSLLQPADAIVS